VHYAVKKPAVMPP